jgi:hypothetical protein
VLRGHGTFYEWDHYPPGDVYDQETHSQYYYHTHPVELRGGEHGHFHTFLRPKGMPKGVRPISMDRAGYPTRLFTTNRWVTGEAWYDAEGVIRMLDRFEIDHARPSWPTNRWVTGMIRLFRPQIAALIHERDQGVARWAAQHPGENVYEDRGAARQGGRVAGRLIARAVRSSPDTWTFRRSPAKSIAVDHRKKGPLRCGVRRAS